MWAITKLIELCLYHSTLHPGGVCKEKKKKKIEVNLRYVIYFKIRIPLLQEKGELCKTHAQKLLVASPGLNLAPTIWLNKEPRVAENLLKFHVQDSKTSPLLLLRWGANESLIYERACMYYVCMCTATITMYNVYYIFQDSKLLHLI